MEKRGTQINYLSFVDDIIIFLSSRSKTLELIMKVLAVYKGVSGQLINKNKSHFIMHDHAFKRSIVRVKHIISFLQK